MKKTIITLGIILASPFAVLHAQTENETDISTKITETEQEKLRAMEEELVFVQNTASKMWLYIHNSNYNNNNEYLTHSHYSDMIDLLCEQFKNMLNQMLIEDKEMTYPFANLQSNELLGTSIVWSTDSLLRVFSWMLPGGTAHFYGNAIQYKNTNLVVNSFSFGNEYNEPDYIAEDSYEYDIIHTLKNNNKTIYILSGSTMFSTRISSCQLISFSIQDEIMAENIFKDENRNITNKISISYEIGCSNASTPFPRPTIDVNKKKVCLPEITEECFTGKFIEIEIK